MNYITYIGIGSIGGALYLFVSMNFSKSSMSMHPFLSFFNLQEDHILLTQTSIESNFKINLSLTQRTYGSIKCH